MAHNQHSLIQLSQYLGLRGVAGLIHCFNVEQNMHTAATFGSLFASLSPTRLQRTSNNIALSFPELSHEQADAMARRSIQNMFQLFMVETIATPRLITSTTWPNYIHLKDLGPVLVRLLSGERMIFITGHCGNWELLGYAMAVLGFPLHALARPLDNRYLNRWLMGIREARGMRIITKFGATEEVQNILNSPGGRIGFIADQNAGNSGLFVPFFGRLASSYKSIGLLAMHHEVPIVCGCARRLGPRLEYDLYCSDIIEPEDWKSQPDPLFYITARYNRAMEQMVRLEPSQYLWLHRRWKSRPRHERAGKPVPSRLIAKLESLPWMNQPELDRIIEHSNTSAASKG